MDYILNNQDKDSKNSRSFPSPCHCMQAEHAAHITFITGTPNQHKMWVHRCTGARCG